MEVDVLGYVAGFLIVLCYIPQIYKIIKNRQANDLSLYMYLILFIAQILFIVYGVLKQDIPIIFVNSLSALLCAVIIFLSFYYS
jgi:MtN3 and saliva related transmembrane protein